MPYLIFRVGTSLAQVIDVQLIALYIASVDVEQLIGKADTVEGACQLASHHALEVEQIIDVTSDERVWNRALLDDLLVASIEAGLDPEAFLVCTLLPIMPEKLTNELFPSQTVKALHLFF